MAALDVYRDWLEIADADRPLNYYQLLKLTKFEDDVAKIRKQYRKLNAHVRKYASGQYAKQSQDLLNELAKAMLCLTDARRKREYDASLGRADKKGDKRRTFEELLLARQVVDPAKLKKARDFGDAIGLNVRDALVQQKMVEADVVVQLYAESIGLPYLDFEDLQLDEALIARVPALLARPHSCAPVLIDEGQLLVASPNPLTPEVEEELRLRLNMPIRSVLCSPQSINGVIEKYYPKEKMQAELSALAAGKKNPVPTAPGQPGKPGAAKAKAMTPEERKNAVALRGIIAFVPFAACFLGGQAVMSWGLIQSLGIGAVLGAVTFGLGMLFMKR